MRMMAAERWTVISSAPIRWRWTSTKGSCSSSDHAPGPDSTQAWRVRDSPGPRVRSGSVPSHTAFRRPATMSSGRTPLMMAKPCASRQSDMRSSSFLSNSYLYPGSGFSMVSVILASQPTATSGPWFRRSAAFAGRSNGSQEGGRLDRSCVGAPLSRGRRSAVACAACLSSPPRAAVGHQTSSPDQVLAVRRIFLRI